MGHRGASCDSAGRCECGFAVCCGYRAWETAHWRERWFRGYTCPLNCRDPSEKDGNEVNRSVLQGLKELTEFGYATKIPVQISFENARREA